jgi:hypothetical protein
MLRLLANIIMFMVILMLFLFSCMLSSGCKLNLLIKQIWLKHESKDPLLVAIGK